MTILIQDLVDEDFGYEKGAGIWGRSRKHDSFVVNESKQKWFWNSAGIRGNVFDYLTLIRGLSKEQAKNYLRRYVPNSNTILDESHRETKPYDKLVELFWISGKDERKYWYDRLLTDDTIDKYRLGYFEGWYFIPIYIDGEFSNFQCRRDYPTKKMRNWYKDTPTSLYNDGILPFIDTVFIVEGTVDSILLSQNGFPSVSTKGANIWLPEWNYKFSHIKNIYYVRDNDDAGMSGARLVSKSLGMERVKIVSFDGEEVKFDSVDFFRKYKTTDAFREHINTASFLYEIEDVTRNKKKGYRK